MMFKVSSNPSHSMVWDRSPRKVTFVFLKIPKTSDCALAGTLRTSGRCWSLSCSIFILNADKDLLRG